MVLNPAFNFYENTLEQTLYEDLIIESIQMYGYDMLYIPRRLNSYNDVLNEDNASYYNNYYRLEMYIKSFDGFTGDGIFLSKFNVEVRNEITFTVAKRRYHSVVGIPENSNRPKEGDLIWLKMDKKLFMIKNVQQYNVFYQNGSLQTWDITCEPFEYQGEHLQTGIPAVDIIESNLSLDTASGALMAGPDLAIIDELGFPIIIDFDLEQQSHDFLSDTFELNNEAIGLVDFSEDNPFSENF